MAESSVASSPPSRPVLSGGSLDRADSLLMGFVGGALGVELTPDGLLTVEALRVSRGRFEHRSETLYTQNSSFLLHRRQQGRSLLHFTLAVLQASQELRRRACVVGAEELIKATGWCCVSVVVRMFGRVYLRGVLLGSGGGPTAGEMGKVCMPVGTILMDIHRYKR